MWEAIKPIYTVLSYGVHNIDWMGGHQFKLSKNIWMLTAQHAFWIIINVIKALQNSTCISYFEANRIDQTIHTYLQINIDKAVC